MHTNYVNLKEYCFYSFIYMYTTETLEPLLVSVLISLKKKLFPQAQGTA